MKSKLLFLSFLIIISFFSCDKDDKIQNEKLLAGETGNNKSWKLVSASWQKNMEQTQDVLLNAHNCVKDDIFIFYNDSNHTYEAQEGNIKCFDEVSPIEGGSWSLTNKGHKLSINFNPEKIGLLKKYIGVENSSIIELTNDILKIEANYQNSQYDYSSKVILTFNKM